MGRIAYNDLDYVNVLSGNEMAAIYGGFNWGNLFSNIFTYVPLNLNFSKWGWNFGVKANSNGIGLTGSGNGFSFGFSYGW